MKKPSVLLLAGALTLAACTALVARVLMRPPPPVTIVKEVETPRRHVTPVLVAKHDLAPGDFIDGTALEWREMADHLVRASYIAAGVDTDRLSRERGLYGATVRGPLEAGVPIARDLVVHSGEPGFIAAVLGPDMRAVSIPTSAMASNAGLVSAGDWVDVILSLERGAQKQAADKDGTPANPFATLAAQTILQRVRVLALNNNAASIAPAAVVQAEGSTEKKPAGNTGSSRAVYETITLEVSPEQAERLAVAREVGTLQVALRGLRDEGEVNPAGPAGPVLVAAQGSMPASGVTRLDDATAIFRGQSRGGAPVTVKTYMGVQQGALTFNQTP